MSTNLTQRVQDLPPELFIQIREDVLLSLKCSIPASKEFVYDHITANHVYPTALHLTHDARQAFGAQYFKNYFLIFDSATIFRNYVFALDEKFLKLTPGFRVLCCDWTLNMDGMNEALDYMKLFGVHFRCHSTVNVGLARQFAPPEYDGMAHMAFLNREWKWKVEAGRHEQSN